MEEIPEGLWICPVCTAEHSAPVISCRRCECQILLLNKIKLRAYEIKKEGFVELAERLYDSF